MINFKTKCIRNSLHVSHIHLDQIKKKNGKTKQQVNEVQTDVSQNGLIQQPKLRTGDTISPVMYSSIPYHTDHVKWYISEQLKAST